MKKLSNFLVFFANYKYIITVVISAMIIGVIDEDCILKRSQRWQVLSELQYELDLYKERYDKDTRLLNSLKEHDNLEKFARENYYMHRDNEDVFIIIK